MTESRGTRQGSSGIPADPAGEHRDVTGTFTERVRGAVGAWDAPTPVAAWTARDVVRHLTTWFPGFLAGGTSVLLVSGPDVDDDPVAAWEHQCREVQAMLDDPGNADAVFAHPQLPPMPLGQAVSRFYTTDVFLHTWDLARATGQPDRLDPERCRVVLEAMEPMDEVLRRSGQYGPRVPVPADTDWQTRLLGFIGRDPWWRPPS